MRKMTTKKTGKILEKRAAVYKQASSRAASNHAYNQFMIDAAAIEGHHEQIAGPMLGFPGAGAARSPTRPRAREEGGAAKRGPRKR